MNKFNEDPLMKHDAERYELLDSTTYEQLSQFLYVLPEVYQLKIIKRQRKEIKKGDIFIVNIVGNIFFYGIVLNANIDNSYGENLYVICLLNKTFDKHNKNNIPVKINAKDIMIGPEIVTKGYWTSGFFYNINKTINDLSNIKYGFFRKSKRDCVNEYCEMITTDVDILGRYAITTMTGVASTMHKELIMDRSFLSDGERAEYEEYMKNILKI